jgi:hypothetical protein
MCIKYTWLTASFFLKKKKEKKKRKEEKSSLFFFSSSFFSPVFSFAGTTFFFPLAGNFFEAGNKIQESGSSFILAKKLPTKHPQNHQQNPRNLSSFILAKKLPTKHQKITNKIKEIYLVSFWPKNYQQNSKKSPTKSKNHRNRPVDGN